LDVSIFQTFRKTLKKLILMRSNNMSEMSACATAENIWAFRPILDELRKEFGTDEFIPSELFSWLKSSQIIAVCTTDCGTKYCVGPYDGYRHRFAGGTLFGRKWDEYLSSTECASIKYHYANVFVHIRPLFIKLNERYHLYRKYPLLQTKRSVLLIVAHWRDSDLFCFPRDIIKYICKLALKFE
jgi:hypothetical protein